MAHAAYFLGTHAATCTGTEPQPLPPNPPPQQQQHQQQHQHESATAFAASAPGAQAAKNAAPATSTAPVLSIQPDAAPADTRQPPSGVLNGHSVARLGTGPGQDHALGSGPSTAPVIPTPVLSRETKSGEVHLASGPCDGSTRGNAGQTGLMVERDSGAGRQLDTADEDERDDEGGGAGPSGTEQPGVMSPGAAGALKGSGGDTGGRDKTQGHQPRGGPKKVDVFSALMQVRGRVGWQLGWCMLDSCGGGCSCGCNNNDGED